MIFFRERWSGIAPVNVRRVGESREIVKQTDSGFGVAAQADPGGPLSPDSPCPSGLSHMTLSWVGTPVLAPSSNGSSVHFSSVTQSCQTLCSPMNCSMPGLLVHHHLLEFTQTHIHRFGDAIQPSHPLWSPFPPAPNPSHHQSFYNESTLCMRWPKYWSFSFSIIPSKEIPGLISFRMDWLDLLAIQGTLKSLLQCHSLKASIL